MVYKLKQKYLYPKTIQPPMCCYLQLVYCFVFVFFFYYTSSISQCTKESAVISKLKSMNDTIDKIKSAVAGNIDLRVMRADLNERYLPGLSNSVSCLLSSFAQACRNNCDLLERFKLFGINLQKLIRLCSHEINFYVYDRWDECEWIITKYA